MLPISATYPTRLFDPANAGDAPGGGLNLAQRARMAAGPASGAAAGGAGGNRHVDVATRNTATPIPVSSSGPRRTAQPDAGRLHHWFGKWLSQQHGLSAEQRREFGADWIRQTLARGMPGQPLQPRALLMALLARLGVDPERLPAVPAHVGRPDDVLNDLAGAAFEEAALAWFMSEVRQRAATASPRGASVNIEQMLLQWISAPRDRQPMPGVPRDDSQAMVEWLLTQTGTREQIAALMAGPDRAPLRDAIGPGLYRTAINRDFAVTWFVEHMRDEIFAPDKNPFLSED